MTDCDDRNLAAALEYRHVDVFAEAPFAGNGLIVAFGDTRSIRAEALVCLTAELRQFELIVVDFAPRGDRVWVRIFTAQEELPFAGDPLIGAAAALHDRHGIEPARSWVFVIAGREISVRSQRTERYHKAEMNQGSPVLGSPLAHGEAARFAPALDLRGGDLHSLPMRVVSTGLPYLIVPVSRGLKRARIVVEDFEMRLASVGAKFVYVLIRRSMRVVRGITRARSRTSRPGVRQDLPRPTWSRTDSSVLTSRYSSIRGGSSDGQAGSP